ncbi:MAG: tyrosine--tRNA ligase [Deltaproteobacteria bacterium]|nr:tyrosine--tRNA ligase [Deltaproteobacteria bacterium]
MKKFAHPNEQLQIIMRGAVDVVEREELLAKLTRSYDSSVGLTILAGFDPSSPDLHLGHTVLLRKMRQFQELGHDVIFLIGDYTGKIGDPSGQDKTRPQLSKEQIDQNTQTYKDQVYRILDPEQTRIEYNSSWLTKLPLEEILSLAEHVAVKDLVSRPDLGDRTDLQLRELLYPVLQAYDSIHLKVDVEVGGEDQIPNLILARKLMTCLGIEPQCILATELLEGIDAHLEEGQMIGKKMSKSEKNTIGISESADQIRGKIRRLDHGLVWRYFELLTDCSMPQIRAYQSDLDAGKRSWDEILDRLADDIIDTVQGTSKDR